MIIGYIARIVLFVISLASSLLGIALSGIGIWMVSSKDAIRSVLSLVDASSLPDGNKHKAEVEGLLQKSDILSSVGTFVIIIGILVALASVFGCLGAVCPLKIFLAIYIGITGALFVAIVVLLFYTGTLKMRMNQEIQKNLRRLQSQYFISIISLFENKNTGKAIVTAAIHFMQFKLKCCGVDKVGDARTSHSWLQSERRLTKFIAAGVPMVKGLAAQADQPVQADGTAAGKNIPPWLKDKVPSSFELPAGITVPDKLPPGFKLPDDFEQKIRSYSSAAPANRSALLSSLFESVLTVKTPLTCCKLSSTNGLLNGKYDAKSLFNKLEDPRCPFSSENVAVQDKTCFDALMEYISKFQYTVVTIGIILSVIMGTGVLCALWIFCLEGSSSGENAAVATDD